MISTSRPDFPQQLAKLAKLLRKEKRLVGVLADGREGDLVEHDILARKVLIGRGAPVLAHLSNAAVFFTRSRWDGEGFMMDLMEGPAPSPGGGRDGFENEFFRFYAEGLRRILLGAPEDMAPQGGVFQSFV